MADAQASRGQIASEHGDHPAVREEGDTALHAPDTQDDPVFETSIGGIGGRMNHTRIEASVLGVLSRATISGCTVKLVEQLERAMYVKANKVLEALGGKWTRTIGAHLFEEDPENRIAEAISTGSYVRPESIGFFETPEGLAEKLVSWADIHPDMYCLEPSAGRGRIIRAMEKRVSRRSIVAIERDENHYHHLLFTDWQAIHADFLEYRLSPECFSRICMNPPFAKQQDIDHVNHAYTNYLKPGGILTAIMSAGTTFRTNLKAKAFRQLIEDVGEIRNLPEDSFKESGTGVRTIMVRLEKPCNV
jgi:hypothetical protein